MQRVFIGLLVGVCLLMFSLPLMAADSPKGLDLSTLQTLDNAQLNQVRGQGWGDSYPPGISMQANYPNPPYINGTQHAWDNFTYHTTNGNGPKTVGHSRVFQGG